MNLLTRLAILPFLAISLQAQGTTDTLGGTSTSASRTALAEANVIRVDKTVWLWKIEFYLGITGAETLTFFRYRYHSQQGAYVKDWTRHVKVTGTGLGWYSTGTIALPLVAGNHYILGVSWTGTVTCHYNLGTSGSTFSFGSWYSGSTPTGLPATAMIGGVNRAQYHQRLYSAPLSNVRVVGTSCKKASSPRLVAAEVAYPGGKLILDLVDAAGSAPAIHVWSLHPALTNPISLFGCSLWVSPFKSPVITLATVTNAAGYDNLTMSLPAVLGFQGQKLAWQTLVVSPGNLVFTNALELTF